MSSKKRIAHLLQYDLLQGESTPTAGSDRPEEPWEMTRAQYDESIYAEECERFIGERIVRRLGTSDPQEILDFYVKKYDLQIPIRLISNPQSKNTLALGEIQILYEEATKKIVEFRINLDTIFSHKDPMRRIAVLRHEIEHAVDYEKRGFVPDSNEARKVPLIHHKKKDETLGDMLRRGTRGHHVLFENFELDYLRRRLIEDALEAGYSVSEDVLADVGIATKGKETRTPKHRS